MPSGHTDAVLLLAHGAPEAPDEIPAFLTSMRRGRPPSQAVLAAYEARYRAIGGRSPMADTTRRIRDALARRLDRPVFLGTRHSKPTIAQALQRAQRRGVRHLTAICLTPYEGRLTTGAYRRAVTSAANDLTDVPLHVNFVTSWCREPDFLSGLTTTVEKGLTRFPTSHRDRVTLFFSAHSLPATVLEEGDPYPHQIARTAAHVAAQLNVPEARWHLTYQSVPAGVPEPWLGPNLKDELIALSERAITDSSPTAGPQALIVPIGFVLDNLETLYDLDVELRGIAQSAKVRFERAPALNDHPLLIQSLASAVTRTSRRGPHLKEIP